MVWIFQVVCKMEILWRTFSNFRLDFMLRERRGEKGEGKRKGEDMQCNNFKV